MMEVDFEKAVITILKKDGASHVSHLISEAYAIDYISQDYIDRLSDCLNSLFEMHTAGKIIMPESEIDAIQLAEEIS